MPHNFRRHLELALDPADCAFVSKAGADGNDGLTPNTPKRTVADVLALGRTHVIIGAGVYAGESVGNALLGKRLHGDGTVVLQGTAAQTFAQPGSLPASSVTELNDLVFFRYGQVLDKVGANSDTLTFNRCRVLGGLSTSTIRGNDYCAWNDCTLHQATLADETVAAGQGHSIAYCNLLGCTVAAKIAFHHTYADPATDLALAGAAATAGVLNNVQGPLTWQGTAYATLAALQAAEPTALADSFSADPQFNNALRQDYTLRFTSPHLVGVGPRHIRVAQGWYLGSSCAAGDVCTTANTWLVNSANGAQLPLLDISGFSWSGQGSLYVTENTAGNFTATYRTAPLQVAGTPQRLRNLPCLTGLNFNTSFPATEANFNSNQPELLNNNVPSGDNFVSGAAGRNPHRLTVAMRWSTQQTPDNAVDGDWVTGAAYLPFEINREPTWNQGTGTGNGDPGYDVTPASVQPIFALWVQFAYTARNNHFDL